MSMSAFPSMIGYNASLCLSSWAGWFDTTQYKATATTTYVGTLYSTETYTSWPSNPSTSTFCDGIPRRLERTYEGFAPLVIPTSTITRTGLTTLKSPAAPACTVYPKECRSFQQSYSASVATITDFNSPLPTSPPCEPEADCTNIQNCTLSFDVSVYYWPESVQPTGVCNSAASVITPAPTGSGPNIAVVDGITMTSPSVYLVGNTVTAFHPVPPPFLTRGCGTRTGDVVISVAPSRLTTYKPLQTITSNGETITQWYNPSSVKLKDFNWPVSSSVNCSTQAATAASGAAAASCTTALFDPYAFNPAIAVPTEMKSQLLKMAPDYAGCKLGDYSSAYWRPITTLSGDPRYTPGWSLTSFPTTFTESSLASQTFYTVMPPRSAPTKAWVA